MDEERERCRGDAKAIKRWWVVKGDTQVMKKGLVGGNGGRWVVKRENNGW